MKIGIITFHKAINYGAVLQTYALQKVLEDMDADPEIIDYKCEYIENTYKLFSISSIRNLKCFISSLIYLPIKISKKNKFNKFRNDYLKLSSEINNRIQLDNSNCLYKSFITGSDQVWNLKCTGYDTTYFLDFVKDTSKKFSYAASFGSADIEKNQKEKYMYLLKDFNKISVREKQGLKIIGELIDKEGYVHLDPTLLLKEESWRNLCSNGKYNNYILIYLMVHSQTALAFAEDLAKQTGCKIIYINSGLTKKVKGTYVRTAGPKEFLSLFAGAKYVVTNSFHGTAFSINFNKEFFVELLPPPSKVNSRLENIMDLLDLRERQIINGKNDNIHKPINYSQVNSVLEEERRNSIKYLRSIVEGCNE